MLFVQYVFLPTEQAETYLKVYVKLRYILKFGLPAYSHHDRFPPWWVFVRDDNGGNLSGDKIPPLMMMTRISEANKHKGAASGRAANQGDNVDGHHT